MRRILPAVVVAAVPIACMALLALVLVRAGGGPARGPDLRLGLVEWPGFYDLHVGAHDGSWTAAGRRIRPLVFPDNPSCNAAFLAGELDLWAGTLSDALLLRARGAPLQVVAAIDTSAGADAILVRSGLGSLAGARVAFEGVHSFSHVFVLEWLRREGVAETAVRMIDMPASQVPAAIAAGRIDAGHAWGTEAEAEAAAGRAAIRFRAADDPGVITEVLGIRRGVLDDSAVGDLLDRLFTRRRDWSGREDALVAAAAAALGRPAAALLPVRGSVVLADAPPFRSPEAAAGLRRRAERIQAVLAERGAALDPGHFTELLPP
jgi:ABC-type nitrate/sulfonate/bicarbonate transport system substrate-binding protein